MHTTTRIQSDAGAGHREHRRGPRRGVIAWWTAAAVLFLLLSLVGI